MSTQKLIVGYSGKQLAVLELNGYDEVSGTVRSVTKDVVETKEALKYLKENNSYNIEIKELLLSRFKGTVSKSKKTLKIFRLPVYISYEAASEHEVEQFVGRGSVVQTPYSYIGYKLGEFVDIARIYVIEHYCMDGKEVWYYDAKGNKTTNKLLAAFGSWNDAEMIRKNKVSYDGTASVTEYLIEL